MGDLRLDAVTRSFNGPVPVLALRGIDLDIPQGSFVAIEGESGGGKSTLLNILGLLDAPSSGAYRIDDRDMARLRDGDSAAHRSDNIGFVFQSFHLLNHRPVIDNVMLPMLYRRIPHAEARLRGLEALGEVGLRDFADALPRTMSGGQRQRVAVARAVAARNPVVLADEPTGNLDSENSDAVLRSFEQLHRAGSTVIIVTHSPVVSGRAARRIRVSDGRVVDDTGGGRSTGHARPAVPGRAASVGFWAALRDATANLMSRPGRSLSMVAALALSLALVVATMGIGGSAGRQVSSEFDTVANEEVSSRIDGNGVDAVVVGSVDEANSRVSSLNGVASTVTLSDLGTKTIRVAYPRTGVETSVVSATGDIERALRAGVTWAPGVDQILSPDTALIGAYLAENIGLASVDLEPTVDLNGRIVTVVGTIDDSPRAPDLMGELVVGTSANETATSTLTTYLTTAEGAAHQVAAELPLALNPFHPSTVQVNAPPKPSDVRASVEANVAASMNLLTIVALIAAVASVVIVSVSSVAQRSAEIGLRRALGAKRSHIRLLLAIESIVTGIAGGSAGAVLGMVGILGVTIARRWTPVFDPALALVAVAGGIVISCVGALAGVIRASGVKPSTALRS